MSIEILTTKRMARRLGVGPEWLEREAQAGRIPAVSADGVYLFDPLTVGEVVQERARRGDREPDLSELDERATGWIAELAEALRASDQSRARTARAELYRLGVELRYGREIEREGRGDG